MPKDSLDPNTGMPDISSEEKEAANSPKSKIRGFLFPIIFIGIGTGIAALIHKFGDNQKYDSRIAIVNTFDMQWVYFAAFIFAYLVIVLNFYPMGYKSLIMRGKSGNLRANMFIYKMAAEGQTESRVVLASEGDEGLYNRSNRALYHFIENSLSLVLAIGLNGFVYPFPTFVCTLIFFFGRIIYTSGYTHKGYGGHVPGFILTTLAHQTLNGMLILVTIKGMATQVVTTDAVEPAPEE